jgi:hypothetical protein
MAAPRRSISTLPNHFPVRKAATNRPGGKVPTLRRDPPNLYVQKGQVLIANAADLEVVLHHAKERTFPPKTAVLVTFFDDLPSLIKFFTTLEVRLKSVDLSYRGKDVVLPATLALALITIIAAKAKDLTLTYLLTKRVRGRVQSSASPILEELTLYSHDSFLSGAFYPFLCSFSRNGSPLTSLPFSSPSRGEQAVDWTALRTLRFPCLSEFMLSGVTIGTADVAHFIAHNRQLKVVMVTRCGIAPAAFSTHLLVSFLDMRLLKGSVTFLHELLQFVSFSYLGNLAVKPIADPTSYSQVKTVLESTMAEGLTTAAMRLTKLFPSVESVDILATELSDKHLVVSVSKNHSLLTNCSTGHGVQLCQVPPIPLQTQFPAVRSFAGCRQLQDACPSGAG